MLILSACSGYYGKRDANGIYRVNEKYWTLKKRTDQNSKGIIDVNALYRLTHVFESNNDSFDHKKMSILRVGQVNSHVDQLEYEQTYKRYLKFFETGQVNKFYILENDMPTRETLEGIDFNKYQRGYYMINTSEFEIEFFQRQRVSINGSMDRHYYRAMIKRDTLHLVRNHHKKGRYIHNIYIKEKMPEEVKNQKVN